MLQHIVAVDDLDQARHKLRVAVVQVTRIVLESLLRPRIRHVAFKDCVAIIPCQAVKLPVATTNVEKRTARVPCLEKVDMVLQNLVDVWIEGIVWAVFQRRTRVAPNVIRDRCRDATSGAAPLGCTTRRIPLELALVGCGVSGKKIKF